MLVYTYPYPSRYWVILDFIVVKETRFIIIAFIVISITMMLLALKVLNTLLEHLHKFKAKLNEEDLKLLNEFIIIPRVLLYILISISFFSFFTLYRELKQ